MGYRYNLIEVNTRFNTFYQWKKSANLDSVKLEDYPALHKHRPYTYIGESRTKHPIMLLRANRFFPQSVQEEDLVKYIGKFIFDVLDQ